ncbi:MAG: polysaccharide biosynthesis/export family protein [Cyclobacteriaceae bacterium]|nr:polysaccharide biosynthesis/export family protein [Cyclobacteriaceae bacterium]
MLKIINTYVALLTILLVTSCGTYRKNIMLQVGEGASSSEIDHANLSVNYIIQPSDILQLEVFTNSGERIIDPDFELTKELGGNQANVKPKLNYIVNADGSVKLPMVGIIKLDRKTLREAELFLEEEYGKFYDTPFVSLQFVNKRVTVVGAVNQVVELKNENIKLIEVLAMADAIDNDAIVQNIRLIRDGQAYILDLSNTEDVANTNVMLQPDDIIYVEPIRRPFIEAVKDYGPIISLVSSITAIVVIITNSK